MSKAPVVCFIDDDSNEISRFVSAFGREFDCVTGTSLDACLRSLKEKKLKPDLWILDLYFPEQGVVNTAAQREEWRSVMRSWTGRCSISDRTYNQSARVLGVVLICCGSASKNIELPW